MTDTCQTCPAWSGQICTNRDSPNANKLTGAGWTCTEHGAGQPFSEYLARRFPVSGPLRGGRDRLANDLGVEPMRISHWVSKQSVPSRALVPRLAESLSLRVEQVERMILTDVRERAERNWLTRKRVS